MPTGRAGKVEAEAKCFCNLAFAQTQLKNFTAAAEHFSSCLSKAHAVGNLLLQLQAQEGLGSVNFSTEQFSKAVNCFQQALKVLDEIGEETGMARERVMEKLSVATQALKRQNESAMASESEGGGGSGGGGGGVRVPVKKHVKVKKITRHHSRGPGGRGSGSDAGRAQLANGGPRNHGPGMSEATDFGGPSSSKGVQLDSSYDRQVQAYMDTYRHSTDPSLASSSLTSVTSSSTSSVNPLGASIFSRDLNQLSPSLPPTGRWASRSPHPSEVPEGSLALGLDTRQQFTTVEVEQDGSKGKGKRGKLRRKKGRKAMKIVPLNSSPSQQAQQPSPPHPNTPPPPPANGAGQSSSSSGRHSTTRSSLCLIL